MAYCLKHEAGSQFWCLFLALPLMHLAPWASPPAFALMLLMSERAKKQHMGVFKRCSWLTQGCPTSGWLGAAVAAWCGPPSLPCVFPLPLPRCDPHCAIPVGPSCRFPQLESCPSLGLGGRKQKLDGLGGRLWRQQQLEQWRERCPDWDSGGHRLILGVAALWAVSWAAWGYYSHW